MSKTKAIKIVESIIFIVLGILIACSILDDNMLSIIIGVAAIVFGLFVFAKEVVDSDYHNLVTPNTIIAALLVGCGISMCCNFLNIVNILIDIIGIGLASVGALLLIDAIIKIIKKQNNYGLTLLVVGLVLLALGLMVCLWPEFRTYTWVIFGVVLAIYGIYLLIVTLIKVSKTKTTSKKTK